MKIQTTTTLTKGKPVSAPCSLGGECVIEEGESRDYQLLACYHYRDTGYPPAVHQVYRARHVPSGRTVGVIVYAAPALNLGIRNRIFGDRFKIGGTPGTNESAAGRLNKEVELIIRVVVHPSFRGTGVGQRLISETLMKRPYRYIEMSAAMGHINPFAEKAGMTRVEVPRPLNTERVLSALRAVGVKPDQIGNPNEIMRHLEGMAAEPRAAVEKELLRYATRWIKSRTKREAIVTVEGAVKRVAGNALLQNIYYIFEKPDATPRTSGPEKAARTSPA